MSIERIYQQKNDTSYYYYSRGERDKKLNTMKNFSWNIPKNVYTGEYKNIENKTVFYIVKKI